MLKRIAVCLLAGVACADAAGEYLGVTWFKGEIWRIDEQAGTSTLIGSIGTAWRANALTVSADGRYYATASSASSGGEWLFEIDPETGGSAALFNTGLSDVRSMSFAPDGTLRVVQYDGLTNSALHTVDLATQHVSGPTTLFGIGVASPGFQGFAIDGDGVGYMAGPSAKLARVNIATGGVSRLLGANTQLGVQGLGFDGSGGLVGIGYQTGGSDAFIWSFDDATGSLLSTAVIDRQDYRGLAYIVPAPGVLVWVLPVLCVGSRGRRG